MLIPSRLTGTISQNDFLKEKLLPFAGNAKTDCESTWGPLVLRCKDSRRRPQVEATDALVMTKGGVFGRFYLLHYDGI